MADNTQLPATGTGTADIIVATDKIGGVDYQRTKVVWGADGTATDTSAAAPLPVVQTGTLNVGTVTAVTAISNALPAGTNGIGKLTANGGVIIGDVNIVSDIPGVAATSLGKAEDAAHSSGDTGVMGLGVRSDTLATTANATGDYVPSLYDALGAQYVVAEERIFSIVVTPTVSSSPAYSVNDVMGGLMTFANAARFSAGPIVIESVVISCKTQALLPALDLVLFDRSVSVAADNAVNAFSDADSLFSIGVISSGPWSDFAAQSISTRAGIGLAATLNGTDLFAQLVTRSAVTLGSTSDIQVRLTVRQG